MASDAIKAISSAVTDWDIACEVLASGGSLAEATRAKLVADDMSSFDANPVSVRVDADATCDAATIATIAPAKGK